MEKNVDTKGTEMSVLKLIIRGQTQNNLLAKTEVLWSSGVLTGSVQKIVSLP